MPVPFFSRRFLGIRPLVWVILAMLAVATVDIWADVLRPLPVEETNVEPPAEPQPNVFAAALTPIAF